MFASEALAYLNEAPFRFSTLVNFRLGWKGLPARDKQFSLLQIFVNYTCIFSESN